MRLEDGGGEGVVVVVLERDASEGREGVCNERSRRGKGSGEKWVGVGEPEGDGMLLAGLVGGSEIRDSVVGMLGWIVVSGDGV